jgi:Arc/MetJ-type ribon-helix-helix transcriptional regulator
MSATISLSQNELIKDLLAAGRFKNKSEILRRGLELVKREVEAERMAPLPASDLAACYAAMSAEDLDADSAMGRASAKPAKGEM